MSSIQLSLIAATGHEPPPGAHLLIVGVLIVGVIVALVAGARRRRDAADELHESLQADDAERKGSEP